MGSLARHDLKRLIEEHGLTSIVETGTYVGDGVQIAFDSGIKKIFSVEIHKSYYKQAKARFSKCRNVKLFLGNSIDILPKIISFLHKDDVILWWLDAHISREFGNEDIKQFPLEDELRLIVGSRHIANDLFIMDDLRIYETGKFENGNWEDRKEYGAPRGIKFVRKLLGKTHSITKQYEDEGYIVAFPKK